MNNNYNIVKNIEKIKRGYATNFLDLKMQNEIKKKLKKDEYNIYYPYKEAEKVLFYSSKIPEISLLEIKCSVKLEHREILGTIFSLGLDASVFGDIVIDNNQYYIFVLDSIKDYLLNNLTHIKNNFVMVEEVDLETLKNYQKKYEEIEIISSSERIDTIISHLININRTKVKELFKNKDIILNYNVLLDYSKKLQENDIFSIRRYGKYKYKGIKKETKSGNLIVVIDKYI